MLRSFLVPFAGMLAVAAAPAAVEFNRQIRPILSDRCFACHGPDAANRKAGLRLDTESGVLATQADNRRAVVPGQPDSSELVRRISSGNPVLRMPPEYLGHAKLTDSEISLFRRWIEEGAKWQRHWSFLPPQRPAEPDVKDSAWPRNPLDRFVLGRLEREGLHPSPEAGRPTLIRRVSLDLTGLPPTPEEVDAFVADRSRQAYEKVVDRLLASPNYAERMAIRWLEAARYADTNGYQSDGARDMWRWRDWVIDAFQRNMPFDRFTVEQIAGDLLPGAALSQKIASGFHRNHRTNAEGGIVEEEFRVEYVADRVETTSTVWLGLTLGCARCHDHKYDPFKQKEFYRLFAFFNNVPERGLVYNFGNEEPFVKAPTPENERRLAELDKNVAEAGQRWAALRQKLGKAQAAWEKKLRQGGSLQWTVPDGQIAYFSLDGPAKIDGCETSGSIADCQLPLEPGKIGQARHFDGQRFVDAGDVAQFSYMDPFTLAAWIYPESPDGAIVSRTEDYLEGEGYALYLMNGKLHLNITRRYTDISLRLETADALPLNRWQHVAVTYDGHRKGKGVGIYVDGQPRETRILFDELTYPYGPKEPFRIGAGGGAKYRFRGLIDDVRVYKIALTAEQAGTLPLLETMNEVAAVPPARRTPAQSSKLSLCFLDKFAPGEIRRARQALSDAREERHKYEESIPTVMVMAEREIPRDTFVLKRGAYDAHGEKVTPGVPEILPPLPAGAPANRLGLARWLVDRSNPLTARVTVNRYWQMLFGTGLVKTAEDFGSQGEWPLHPELLDWLAVEFMDSGWNVKGILKTIVTSATYRQSSRLTPELLQKDPDNRLLARATRMRLPAEMIRDQALAASGLLVEKLGGPSVKPYQPPGLWQELAGGKGYVADKGEGLYRRSLYTYWKRTVSPPSMINFDSPTRETCTVRETRTNTPLQALDLMNDVIFVEAARKLAERMIREGGRTPAERVARGYRLVLGREPEPGERKVVSDLLARFQRRFASERDSADEFLKQGESARDKSIAPADLAAFTGVASLILNLDEAVTRE